MNVVGLDIGSTAVRGVELKATKKGKLALLRYLEVPLPYGAVIRGEVIDYEIVGIALKKLWSEGRFKSKNVALGICNERILVRDLVVPKMSLQNIRQSLPFQVQSMLQIPLEDSLLDFYPVSEASGEHGPTISGLLVAAEKREILGNIRAAERAGLTPVEVDLVPFALNRLLIHRAHVNGTVAVIDVGGNTTSVVISNQGVPLFVRIIPVGGDDLTQALMSGMDIDYVSAEARKRLLTIDLESKADNNSLPKISQCACSKCSAEFTKANDPRAAEILNKVTGELLGSLRSTVNYFNNTRPQEPVLQVMLTGGGSRLSGFAEALSDMTHIPVTAANPFALVTFSGKIQANTLQESDMSLSVALALALRAQS
jgi:type IV pilus assembly protein PilM